MRKAVCDDAKIVSDEILSGIGFAHGIAANSILQILDNIELLTEGAFEAHVVLRRPRVFLLSYYTQLIRSGQAMTLDQFCSLILMRQHRWVFRALDFRWIIESRHFQGGRLKVWLFEELFAGGTRLAEFMRELGVAQLPPEALRTKANISVTREAAELMRQRMPADPSSWLQQSVSRPSWFEHYWLARYPESQRRFHRAIWRNEALESQAIHQQVEDIANAAAKEADAQPKPAPVQSAALDGIISLLARVNESVRNGYNIEFEKHRYFE